MTRNALAVDTPFEAENIPLFHAPLRGFADMNSIKVLTAKLKQLPDHPTVIHVHHYQDAFTAAVARKLSKRKDVKIVSTRHAVRRGRTSFLFRWIYNMVDTHIFVSSKAYDRFRKSFSGRHLFNLEKSYILRYSLDTPATEEPAPLPTGPFILLYQGYISQGERLERIIEALAETSKRKFRLRICGRGNPDYLDRLRDMAMKLGVMDSIDWHTQSIPTFENACAAHAGIVSLSPAEPVALPSLMLMAAGRPQIVLSDKIDTEYLEDGTTAIFLSSDNPSEIASAISRLVNDPQLCETLGSNACATYNRILSWPHFINVINEIYTK